MPIPRKIIHSHLYFPPQNGVVENYLAAAKKAIGSKEWAKASWHYPGPGKDKCNIFVADLVTAAGGKVPQRYV